MVVTREDKAMGRGTNITVLSKEHTEYLLWQFKWATWLRVYN
jgi:hypothetical protein